jgi:hypothetical protein
LTGATSGTLSGTFNVKQSFLVHDVDLNIIAESEAGPAAITALTISSKMLTVAGMDLSTDTITASRLYRTTTNGTVYFPWLDLDGNTQVTTQDDLSDASLQLIAAPTLGTPPNNLTLISEFRSRLWGVSSTEIDTLRYTDASKMYSWPSTYGLTIGRPGSDLRGITGIIARREFLGVGRQDVLFQIVGEIPSNFRPVKLKENVGIEAPDSVVVYRDTAYWLAKDGVYSWGDEGIKCLSDGKVRSWFYTDTYFNRSRFQYATGSVDPRRNKYKLLLSAAGSSNQDRWIEFDLIDQTWWGPHKTDAFTPTWATTILDANSLSIPVLGSSTGYIFKEQDTRTDNTSTGIATSITTKAHDGGTPDIEKYFGQPSLISKVQTSGALSITPYVGGLSASAQLPIAANMLKGRERLRRLGHGRFAKLILAHSTAGEDIELYGYEIPYHELGRR